MLLLDTTPNSLAGAGPALASGRRAHPGFRGRCTELADNLLEVSRTLEYETIDDDGRGIVLTTMGVLYSP